MNGLGSLHRNLRVKKTVFGHVMSALTDFAIDWEKTAIREKAHVRVYNNCGLRFVYYRKANLAHDPINGMSVVTNEIFMKNLAQACTVTNPSYYPGSNGRENPLRSTIDLPMHACLGPACKYPHLSMRSLQDSVASTSARRVDVHRSGFFMITRLLAHEWMHTHTYGFTDGSSHGTNGHTGDWTYIMGEKKEQVWENAEAIALLIFAAGVADMRPEGMTKGGFTVPRSWDSIPGSHDPVDTNLKWDRDYPFNSAAGGEFVFYEDLTD